MLIKNKIFFQILANLKKNTFYNKISLSILLFF